MVKLERVLTAGGSAVIVFQLQVDGAAAPGLAGGTATVSIRKTTTDRDSPELPRHAATLDAGESTATVILTPSETTSLGPTAGLNYQPCIGDVRVGATDSNVWYFGPFQFAVRQPETAPP